MRLKTPVCDSPSRPEKSVHDLGGGRQFDAERGRVDRVFEGLKFLELGITTRVPQNHFDQEPDLKSESLPLRLVRDHPWAVEAEHRGANAAVLVRGQQDCADALLGGVRRGNPQHLPRPVLVEPRKDLFRILARVQPEQERPHPSSSDEARLGRRPIDAKPHLIPPIARCPRSTGRSPTCS
jgi:hypothetical protein